jgi:hypothetical protein
MIFIFDRVYFQFKRAQGPGSFILYRNPTDASQWIRLCSTQLPRFTKGHNLDYSSLRRII